MIGDAALLYMRKNPTSGSIGEIILRFRGVLPRRLPAASAILSLVGGSIPWFKMHDRCAGGSHPTSSTIACAQVCALCSRRGPRLRVAGGPVHRNYT